MIRLTDYIFTISDVNKLFQFLFKRITLLKLFYIIIVFEVSYIFSTLVDISYVYTFLFTVLIILLIIDLWSLLNPNKKRILDFFLTPKDIKTLFTIKNYGKRGYLILIIVAVSLILAYITLHFSLESVFFIFCLFSVLYWEIDERLPISLGIVSLFFIPILLSVQYIFYLIDLKDSAERIAVWAFYFLAIGLIRLLFGVDSTIDNKANEIEEKEQKLLPERAIYHDIRGETFVIKRE
jgi:hypothetical protein